MERLAGEIAPRLERDAGSICPLSPFLRGEGWGEGLFPERRRHFNRRKLRLNFDLSPQAGQGEVKRIAL
jgi:hypothetical protein